MEPTEDKILFMLLDRGELVMATVKEDPKNHTIFIFETPALVVNERAQHGVLGFMLVPWLPHELVQGAQIHVTPSVLRGTLIPTPELLSFYKVWAKTEQEKMKLFANEFSAQVTAIEKFHIEKYERTRDRKKREVFVSPHTLPDTLIALFEEDNEWGDPSITH